MYDEISRQTAVRDQIDALRRDFQTPPGVLRTALGRHLIRLGLRLQGVEPNAARHLTHRPSTVARWS